MFESVKTFVPPAIYDVLHKNEQLQHCEDILADCEMKSNESNGLNLDITF